MLRSFERFGDFARILDLSAAIPSAALALLLWFPSSFLSLGLRAHGEL